MDVKEKLYTAEEFWEFYQLPENEGRRFELVDGEIIEMPPSSLPNSYIAVRISYFLSGYAIKTGLGHVFGADGGSRLDNNLIRIPDVSFISTTRLVAVTGKLMPPPDLAVEVVSPDEDIFRKAREYLYNGVIEVWAIYPQSRELIIFWLDENRQVTTKQYGIDDIIRNRAILPDFEMPIRDIFPVSIK
ncbi:MAG: Uma2 family endonuclease [Phototrophicales bacterium]|nr:Uma2 family endonuclease [Phototrophicales bacterium]